MCGVAGWFGPRDARLRAATVDRILDEQVARGPDNRATAHLTSVGSQAILGHNRLAIIDLSAAANQPLRRQNSANWITFNGEIYNYLELREQLKSEGVEFTTSSDTEVLLAAWNQYGTQALSRCNGMFAFAVYDSSGGNLWLVRDRFGVKPLYYAIDGQELVFASSQGAVARCLGLPPNVSYATRGAAFGVYDDDTATSAYEGVLAVPAGTFLRARFVDGRLDIESVRYYDLEASVSLQREALATCSVPELIDRTRTLCDRAVQIRLRSDVPVGLSLSGGLDSSTIAALAYSKSRLMAFSFGGPEELLSEGPIVAKLSRFLGTEVRYVSSANGTVLAELFDATLSAQDAPFPSCSVIAQFAVYRRAREEGIKVLLGGQGGDEAFMGYQKFKIFRTQELLSQGRILHAMAMAMGSARSLAASNFGFARIRRQLRRYRGKGPTESVLQMLAKPDVQPYLGYRRTEPLWRRQALDVTRYSLPTLLRYEDRNSMGNSIESRLPFVDYQVVEWGLALPEVVKINKGYGKWILREAVRGQIPEEIRAARWKRGFDANHNFAISSGLGEVVRRRLMEVSSHVEKFVGATLNCKDSYSDERLAAEPSAFTEAVTLIWLGQQLSGVGGAPVVH